MNTKGILAWSWFGLIILLCQCSPPERLQPEEVVQRYQAHVDHNEFDEAKALSTPAEIERLEDLELTLEGLPPDSTLLNTRFSQINCTIREDTAFCSCLVDFQEESYPATYRLIQMEGQWLMDVPVE